MRKIIFTLSLIVMICSCNDNRINQKILQVKVIVADKVTFHDYYRRNQECYPIKISLINNTDSTLHFWTMSCSWDKNFVLNSDAIRIILPGCDKNIVDIEKLATGDTLTYDGCLEVYKIPNLEKTINLRIGFVFVSENISYSYSNFSKILLEKKNHKKDIIWCETPIKLKL